MSKRLKAIQNMRANPQTVRFARLEALIFYQGFVRFNQKGSHISYRHRDGRYFTITKPHSREAYLWASEVLKTLEIIGL